MNDVIDGFPLLSLVLLQAIFSIIVPLCKVLRSFISGAEKKSFLFQSVWMPKKGFCG